MSESILLTLPFEILDLICWQLSVQDLINLSHTSRDVQIMVFQTILKKYKIDLPNQTSELVLTFTRQTGRDFLSAIHTAPSWFYDNYPTISIIYTCDSIAQPEPTTRQLLRLMNIIGRVKTLKRLSMGFSETTYWFEGKSLTPFDKAISKVMALAVKKDCTNLEVFRLGVPHYRFRVSWAFRLKSVAGSLIHRPLIPWRTAESPVFKLTKLSVSSGVPSGRPYTGTQFLTIVNSSPNLTSLSLDLNPEKKATLSLVTAPSLQSFSLKKSNLNSKVFESFLTRHPNIKILDVCSSWINSSPTDRKKWKPLSVNLVCVEQLLCSSELLSYLLQNLDHLPNIKEVTITQFRASQPFTRINQELEGIPSRLYGIASLGLRVYQYRMINMQDFADAPLVRQHVTRLEFEYFPVQLPPSIFEQWIALPEVNFVKFNGPLDGGLTISYNPIPNVPAEYLRRIAGYPKVVRVAIGEQVYDMEYIEGREFEIT